MKSGLSMLSVLALFLGINLSVAQERTLKVVSETETVGTVRGAKPVTVIPEALAKAINAAKTDAKEVSIQDPEYVWFPSLDDDCEGLDLTAHPAPNPAVLPATQTIANNPEGCLTTGSICCAKGYAMSDVEYDATNQRWIPKTNPESDVITVFRPEPQVNK